MSFAGEDRPFVENVAQELKNAGIEVFYDGFEEANLWGKDLADHLGKIYSEDCHFVVMFVSKHYAEKAWPSHERQFALGRALKGEKERVLPVRMDNTDVPGLPSTIGYLDVRVLTPLKLAELIRQKLDAE
ncbi:MAG TPA: TIR domain-containing protein [Longimicrobiaceae bacterium]|nr:TIR domain-containing protein [Longimicrobiaceae bacterium]